MKGSWLFDGRAVHVFGRNLSLRFVIIGMLNTGFSTALFMIMLLFGLGVELGSGLALAAGVLFSYYTQSTIVFRHKSFAAFGRFVVTWGLIYLANLGEIRVFMRLGLSAYLAGILATVPTTIVSYVLQRLVVFRVPFGRAA